MAKKKSSKATEVSDDDLDALLEDEDTEETSEEETEEESSEDLDDLLDDSEDESEDDSEDEEEESKKTTKKASSSKKGKSTKKTDTSDKAKTKKKKSESSDGKIEGLTKATEESGVITFNENSGSQGLLVLIRKVGFDKGKIVKFLGTEKGKKFSAKYFSKCDPEKKYAKVAGIIKKLQNAGYKLNPED